MKNSISLFLFFVSAIVFGATSNPIGGGGSSITAVTAPLTLTSGTLAVPSATSGRNGYLTSSDWSTFNGKQDAGNYITALSGDVSASGPGSASATISAATVTGKLLTGFSSGAGSVSASDSILTGFNKVVGNIALKAPLANPSFTGIIGTPLTASRVLTTDGSSNLAASSITTTTLGFLDPTSSIQTQLDAKATSGANSNITSLTGLSTPLSIAQGGTGQATANTALNALLPTQTSNANKYLKTDGTNTSWSTVTAGVSGPGSSTDRAIATYNGTAGDTLRDNSTVTITSAGDLSTTRNRIIIGANSNMALTDSTAFANRTSGTLNTGFGANVFNGLTSGTLNTCIGWGNCTGTITGPNNTTIGVGNLTALTSGSNNNAMGYVALSGCTACSENVAIGTSAMGNCTGSGCTNNTCVGSGACATVSGVSTGSNNVGLGVNALSNGGIGTYNVAIGAGANITSTVANNELVIGGTGGGIQTAVIGQGHTNASPQALLLKSTGGTGTNISGASFTIQPGFGTGTGNGGDFLVKTAPPGSTGTTAGTPVERFRVDKNGNVSVGTAAVSTSATDGFLYIPTTAGTPTGVPTTKTGLAATVIDTTNNKICFYINSAWKCAAGS